jgi:serine/threonine protein kinase
VPGDRVDHGSERFGRYTVLECLGAGGMATVHRATIEIGAGVVREVALKRLLPQLADEKQLVEDFVREAKLAAQLQHPNIVRILELGRTGPTYFIAMELVRGHSLLALMKLLHAQRALAPIGIVVAILAEILDALDYASNASDADGEPLEIVHRDLSPSNLIITDEGNLKIIDFGVAKSVTGKFMTSSGLVKGKLGYMSLEVLAARPIDRRADIFSVGVVAWEMLTGRRLFVGQNEYEVMTKIRKGASQPPSQLNRDCSPELDEIVMHALSRKPQDRWPSAMVMKRALDTVRRTHRQGVREIAAWMRTLIPEPMFDESTTTEITLGESMLSGVVPVHPSVTSTIVRPVEDFEPTEFTVPTDGTDE